MLYVEHVNPVEHPEKSAVQFAQELVAQGAKVIIFTGYTMQADSVEFAQANPEIFVISVGGDQIWADGRNYSEIPNLANLMGRMEYGQMLAGCAAALTTQSGRIGYHDNSISDETRRLAASAYLGAKHCWSNYRGQDPAALKFRVAWRDKPAGPTDSSQGAVDLYANGYDIIISGTYDNEALAVAAQYQTAGQYARAFAYNSSRSCELNAEVCLGTAYFNWGPGYVALIKSAMDGTWQSVFRWNGPDWADINESETSAIGFIRGPALPLETGPAMDSFTLELANGLNLWAGPLNLQDDSPYLEAGETASDPQIWYLPQLLDGMEGQSTP